MSLVWTLESARWGWAALCGLVYAGLCLRYYVLAGRRAARFDCLVTPETPGWTVVYASQAGTAEGLARQTVLALQRAGSAVRCCPLNQLDEAQLAAGGRFLFIVSTAGQGEAPDNGAGFALVPGGQVAAFSRVDFALLALGDRAYPDFCGFGRRLDSYLLERGAHRRFERIEVHRGDPAALGQWQSRLAELAGADEFEPRPDDVFSSWRLVDRKHLNPGSQGGPVYRLHLEAPDGTVPAWESGDLVEIAAPSEPDCPRHYSIASLPGQSGLHLLVRLQRRPDGRPGAVSGWLTEGLAPGGEVMLRWRPHEAFRLGENRGRPLLCIGNGVGLAGLRGHLAARIAAGFNDNWLLFGERSRACDFHYRDELEDWLASDRLERLDTVFSRDGDACRYVQQALRANADLFRAWVARGAAIYVCGSRQGMGEGVDRAIRDLLGAEGYQSLVLGGRYCRDLF